MLVVTRARVATSVQRDTRFRDQEIGVRRADPSLQRALQISRLGRPETCSSPNSRRRPSLARAAC